jgi:hypothetical protein
MADQTLPFVAILIFGGAIGLLAVLSALISLEIQRTVFHMSGSVDAGIMVYFLVMLPGIVVHEAAHWITAKLLGLKPGKFRVWPKRRGRTVGLGRVTALSGGMFLDSLVGIAPLVAGTLLVWWISRQWFGEETLSAAFAANSLRPWWNVLAGAFSQPDAPVWAYLTFTIANGMMPSASDREPIKPVLVYVGLAVVAYAILGLPLGPVNAALRAGAPPLMNLNSALVVTVILDIAAFLVLLLASAITAPMAARSRR